MFLSAEPEPADLEASETAATLNIWEHLWRKDKNGKSCPVKSPDTFVSYANSNGSNSEDTWYFLSRKQSTLLKKKRDPVTKRHDLKELKRKFSASQLKQSDQAKQSPTKLVTTLMTVKKNAIEFTYFTAKEFKTWASRHWNDREILGEYDTFVLQRFVHSDSEQNRTIKADWTPNVCFLHSRTNKCGVNDGTKPSKIRGATYGGLNSLSNESTTKNKSVAAKIMTACKVIAAHIVKLSQKYEEVRAMTLYFKVGSDGHVWLLWGSDFKLSTIRPRTRLFQAFKLGPKTNRRKVGPSPIPLLPAATIAPTKERDFVKPLVDSEDTENVPVRLSASNIPEHTLFQIKTLEKSMSLFGTSIAMPVVKKNLFRCPVEHCVSVEDPKLIAKSEATFKDIIDFYKSGGKIERKQLLWGAPVSNTVAEDDTMIGVAPLFGPRNQEHCKIPKVLQKYVPGGSERRFQLLCKDPKFIHRTVQVCKRCANEFLKRQHLSLRNQTAVTDLFQERIAQRKRTEEIIRLVGGPVKPIRSRNIDRLANPRCIREKFVPPPRPKSAKSLNTAVSSPQKRKEYDNTCTKKKMPRPVSARLCRRVERVTRDRQKFDVPEFHAPPMLPKSLKGWVPPSEWGELLEKNTAAVDEEVSKKRPASTRPRSAPATRRSAAVPKGTPLQVRRQRKIYGVAKETQHLKQHTNLHRLCAPKNHQKKNPRRPDSARAGKPNVERRSSGKNNRPQSADPRSRRRGAMKKTDLENPPEKRSSQSMFGKPMSADDFDAHISFIVRQKQIVLTRQGLKNSLQSPPLQHAEHSTMVEENFVPKTERVTPSTSAAPSLGGTINLNALSPRVGMKTYQSGETEHLV
jgi:hypothetical protein